MAEYYDFPPVMDMEAMWHALELMNRDSSTAQAKTTKVMIEGYERVSGVLGYKEPPRMLEAVKPAPFIPSPPEGVVEREGASIVHQDV